MASSAVVRAPGRSRRRRHQPAPSRTYDLALLGAALVGLLVSLYLAVLDLTGGSALCVAGSDCDIVRASTFGRVSGVPVAVVGVAFFGVVLALAALRTRTSQRLLGYLAGAGVGAAVVFVALQGLVLRSWCPYCLVADGAALAVGARVLWPGRLETPSGGMLRGIVGAVLAVAVLGVGYALNPVPSGPAPATASSAGGSADRLAALADRLRESGAVMYGAYWCPHCQQQKQAFGAAASRLPYVECDPRGAGANPAACQAAGVRAFPTWVINGQTIEGAISPVDLARLSGFSR